MKTTFIAFLFFGLSASAIAGQLADRAQGLTDRLGRIETSLRPADLRSIQYSLDSLQEILQHYDDDEADLICVSNGQPGSFEKFTPWYDGKILGGGTDKVTCQKLVRTVNVGLICLSNGELGSFEKFAVYDLNLGKDLGGGTDLNSCLRTVSGARTRYVCLSNGELGSFEKFQLIDRRTGNGIGGETSLANCLEMIP